MTGFAKEKGNVFRLGFHNELALGLGDPVPARSEDWYDEFTL